MPTTKSDKTRVQGLLLIAWELLWPLDWRGSCVRLLRKEIEPLVPPKSAKKGSGAALLRRYEAWED